MEISENIDRALVGLPDCEQVASMSIDSIKIAYKEGVIKAPDLLPNVVQKIHELSPHRGLSIHEVLLRTEQLNHLATICLQSQLGEDFV